MATCVVWMPAYHSIEPHDRIWLQNKPIHLLGHILGVEPVVYKFLVLIKFYLGLWLNVFGSQIVMKVFP